MRQSIFTAILLGCITVVRAVNDFESIFTTYTKGDDKEVKWKDFAKSDLVKLSLISASGNSRVSLPCKSYSPKGHRLKAEGANTNMIATDTPSSSYIVSDCAEKGKTAASCSRFINKGKYEIDPNQPPFSSLVGGSSYYLELEYIEHLPSTRTGVSKSNNFLAASAPSNSNSSSGSKTKTKSKKKKGKLGKGGIVGIAVGVALVFVILAGYAIVARCSKGRNKGAASKGVDEEHEMGKQANDPLMGQDERVKNTTVWSADIPEDHSKPVEALPKYEPYKATTTGQGAAA